MAEPRPSTDEGESQSDNGSDSAETAPLLADNGESQEHQHVAGIYDPSRPLTRLEKVLAAVGLLLLIISATFIGLFAGTEHTLKKERGRHDIPTTVTYTTTATSTVPAAPTGKPGKVRGICSEIILTD